MLRRTMLIIAAAIASAITGAAPAVAVEYAPFTRAAFDAAQAAGQPIVVDIAASWCPVCASQEHTIKDAAGDPRYAHLTIFKINYDKQKAEWSKFGVTKQGTLIAFKGRREVDRVSFQTDKTLIANLLQSAVR
ncbi:MAG: thioredoxin family protein [Janthinobacterium lividum]